MYFRTLKEAAAARIAEENRLAVEARERRDRWLNRAGIVGGLLIGLAGLALGYSALP